MTDESRSGAGGGGIAIPFGWGFAEATVFFVVPDVAVGWSALFTPSQVAPALLIPDASPYAEAIGFLLVSLGFLVIPVAGLARFTLLRESSPDSPHGVRMRRRAAALLGLSAGFAAGNVVLMAML